MTKHIKQQHKAFKAPSSRSTCQRRQHGAQAAASINGVGVASASENNHGAYINKHVAPLGIIFAVSISLLAA